MKILKGMNLEDVVKVHQYNLYNQLIEHLAFKRTDSSYSFVKDSKDLIVKKQVFDFCTNSRIGKTMPIPILGFDIITIEECLRSLEETLIKNKETPASCPTSFLKKVTIDIRDSKISAEAVFFVPKDIVRDN